MARAEVGGEVAAEAIQQPSHRFWSRQAIDHDLSGSSAAADRPSAHLAIRAVPLQGAHVLPRLRRPFPEHPGQFHFPQSFRLPSIPLRPISIPPDPIPSQRSFPSPLNRPPCFS